MCRHRTYSKSRQFSDHRICDLYLNVPYLIFTLCGIFSNAARKIAAFSSGIDDTMEPRVKTTKPCSAEETHDSRSYTEQLLRGIDSGIHL